MNTKEKKWLASLAAAVLLLAAAGLFLWKSGFFGISGSEEAMSAYIGRFAPYSHIAFFVLQLISVVFAPIPSNLTAAAGALLFGMWPAFLLTAAAVLSGSMLVFLLARQLGRGFADRFVSRRVSERYLEVIRRKRDIFLILVFLFPFFPDDVICILAGLTDIRPLRFFLTVLLTRPWGLLVASAVGGAAVRIPLWGMGLIALAGAGLFFVGMKYGDRLERWLLEHLRR